MGKATKPAAPSMTTRRCMLSTLIAVDANWSSVPHLELLVGHGFESSFFQAVECISQDIATPRVMIAFPVCRVTADYARSPQCVMWSSIDRIRSVIWTIDEVETRSRGDERIVPGMLRKTGGTSESACEYEWLDPRKLTSPGFPDAGVWFKLTASLSAVVLEQAA